MISLNIKRLISVALVALNFAALTACDNKTVIVFAPFDPAFFPIAVPGTIGGFGSAAFDSNDDLIVVGGSSIDVTTVARSDGSVTTLTLIGTAGILLSIVDPGTGVFYIGNDLGDIYSVDSTTGVATLVVNIRGSVNGLVVAPAGYGTFGAQLIAATEGGGVVAVDPTGPTVTPIAAGNYSDLEFALNGTLYTVSHGTGDVTTVSAAGVVATVATLASPDGIAVESSGERLYVADSLSDELFSVTIPGGVVASLGNYDYNSGFFPSGLAFDRGTLIMLTDAVGTMNIEAITP
ncbi:MAG: hypothetical protein WBO34_05285 [Gammaproteobacteria bacterium]